MSYGLRRYETLHRLWWLVFFLLCLFLADFLPSVTNDAQHRPVLSDLGSLDFWTGLHGVGIISAGHGYSKGIRAAATDEENEPAEAPAGQNGFNDNISMVSGALLFLIRTAVIFLLLRLVWLAVQYGGRYLLQFFMSEIKGFGPTDRGEVATGAQSLLPVRVLDERIRRSVASYVLHPFIRLRLALSGFQGNVLPENVLEKERRAVEADWRILYGSWSPYRFLLWMLPLLGLAQTVLLLIALFSGIGSAHPKEAVNAAKPLLDSSIQKEIFESLKPTLSLLLPFFQAVGVAFFLQIASTLLRYLEDLYLSGLDAFLYDRLLSRLPLSRGANDSVVLLEALQRQFREFGAVLSRLEKKLLSPMGGSGLR
ncbi:MAG: hypothetical protein P4L43_20585 [Syntrophobacteraceae bacterium]|nr:hypothetical protein [Syntrophobacteraceae bacterium]